ncbi:MAG TPA: archease, partial [Candidatus Paceibacterota bacterium]|nr:archease [Candidatus Paceibacterota bacterium]
KFKFLEHTADVKFQAFGSTLEKAFSNSALALAEVMTKKTKIKSKIKKEIKVSGKDNSRLLYNFLEEFLFLFDSEGFILSKIEKLNIKEDRKIKLEAEVSGDNVRNYKISQDVKAITYNSMFVRKEKGKFIIQVVLDV